jgi:hypothetical protein
MKIHFRVPPVSKRLHGWRRIARRLKNVFQATLVVEIGRQGHQEHRQDSPCIEQMPVSRASL